MGAFVKPIVFNWSVCQDKPIADQLKMGIRYLDIRVCTDGKTDDFHTFHGLIGQSIESLLKEVKEFLDNHSKEVIFLDFNHFCEVSPDQHLKLIKLIKEYLSSYLSKINDSIETLCLNRIWENNWRALVFYQNEITNDPQFLSGSCIISPWANTEDFHELLPYLEIMLEDEGRKDRFQVCQMILTPKTDTVIKGFYSNLKDKMCSPYYKRINDWIYEQYTGYEHGLNIVIRDFIDENFIDYVIKLNYNKCLYE